MYERWLPVVGYEGWYEVSDLGHIMRVRTGRILRCHPDTSGQPMVSLCRYGIRAPKLVSRLVLQAFVGPCPDGMECCHNDGNPANNRLDNLRWDTHVNNERDKRAHGTTIHGNHNGAAKLRECDVPDIVARSAAGESQRDIARAFGVNQTTIGLLLRGKTWRLAAR